MKKKLRPYSLSVHYIGQTLMTGDNLIRVQRQPIEDINKAFPVKQNIK